ncbi:MAG TPA: hypothetical protein VEU47_20125 [Candidatus Cybelea sp.]|nr:hypothetical protein [Candidatus Cybelea sp.]
MPQAVILKFRSYEEPTDLTQRLEVKAIDVATDLPVASLPPAQMALWLRQEGYQWRLGSSGIWERAA